MTDATIPAYIAKYPDWRGETLRALHALILETVPDARASIKWAQPVYQSGGPMIFLKASSKHVTIGFWRGAALADPAGMLEGHGERMRHLKLRSAILPRGALEAWIREAAKMNAEKGDPTKGT